MVKIETFDWGETGRRCPFENGASKSTANNSETSDMQQETINDEN